MDTTANKITSSSPSRITPTGVAQLAIEVVERTQSTALGLVQDVRGELRTVADSAFDTAEKALTSIVRVARKLTHRFDDALADTLSSAERMVAPPITKN